MGDIQCVHCGQTVRHARRNQVTCGAQECVRAAKLANKQSEWAKARKLRPWEMTKCRVCGAEFYQRQPQIVTCSNPECKRTEKNTRRLAGYYAYKAAQAKGNRECLTCGQPFKSEHGAWICDHCRERNAEICSGSGLGAYL